jgi:cardiolipin synthase
VTRRDIPNLISVARLLLVPPVVLLILERDYGLALLLFFVAGISDGIDGFLAKRNGWQSRLGGYLDPLADKLLMVSSLIVLGLEGLVPLWVTVAVVLRDVVIVGGALAYRSLVGRFEAAPSVISKINTGVQIILVLGVLADRALGLETDFTPLFYVAVVMAIGSGTDYVLQWSRRARQAWRARD